MQPRLLSLCPFSAQHGGPSGAEQGRVGVRIGQVGLRTSILGPRGGRFGPSGAEWGRVGPSRGVGLGRGCSIGLPLLYKTRQSAAEWGRIGPVRAEWGWGGVEGLGMRWDSIILFVGVLCFGLCPVPRALHMYISLSLFLFLFLLFSHCHAAMFSLWVLVVSMLRRSRFLFCDRARASLAACARRYPHSAAGALGARLALGAVVTHAPCI